MKNSERSKKSVGLSIQPDRIPMHGDSKKSIAVSANPDRVPQAEEFEKINNKIQMNSIALSVNTKKLNEKEESTKSIALSMDTSKLYELASKRTVALSVNPEKILRCIQERTEEIQEESQRILEEESRTDLKSRKNPKSKKSIALSISSNMGASRAKSRSSVYPQNEGEKAEETKLGDNEEIVDEKMNEKEFKPFVYRVDQALSVITHTPTHKEGPNSIALSAITHTPTEKSEKQSINLSALHLSQNDYQEDEDVEKSYRSVALSAVRVYGPKNFKPAPRNRDQSVEQSQNYQTDKSISAFNKSINDAAIGKSDIEGIADLVRENKSIAPKSIYISDKSIDPKSHDMTEKSLDPKTINQSEKSIDPKSIYQSEKSINPKSIHQSEKSINPKTVNQTDKSIGPKTVNLTEKSIDPKTVHLTEKSNDPKTMILTEKSIGPITDNKVDKSIRPRSFIRSREEEKYPRNHKSKEFKTYK